MSAVLVGAEHWANRDPLVRTAQPKIGFDMDSFELFRGAKLGAFGVCQH